MVEQCMIFAAGFGTRLQPLTKTKPKALVEIHGQPMLLRLLHQLAQLGIQRVVINAHHQIAQFQQFLKTHPFAMDIELSIEPKILGTGGGLGHAFKYLNPQACWLYNADILCNADLRTMQQQHADQQPMVSLAVQKRVEESSVHVGSNRLVRGFGDDPKNYAAYGFCGIHLVSASFWDELKAMHPIPFSIIDVYRQLLKRGHQLRIWDIEGADWADMGTLQGFKTAEQYLKKSN